MRIYMQQNVYEAALDRMRFIFSEFPHVVPTMSGGKDSTVVLHLALQVAEEMGRLPLPVLFIDQEAEWLPVIDYIRSVFQDPRVKPVWLQVPIHYTMGTSGISDERFFFSWDPALEGQWMREKEPDSIHENTFGTDRFKKMFRAWLRTTYPDEKACTLGGVRTEESPARFLGLTCKPKYKWVTWGSHNEHTKTAVPHYTFYPIYDWTYQDVWKAIHEHKWPYCELYDRMYRYGLPVLRMRVSSVNHELGQMSLFYMHEMDPETWELALQRLQGANALAKMGRSEYFVFKLPRAFRNWREYRDYLTENLITDPDIRQRFIDRFKQDDQKLLAGKYNFRDPETLWYAHINTVTTMDTEFSGLGTFEAAARRFATPRTDLKYVERPDADGDDDPTSI